MNVGDSVELQIRSRIKDSNLKSAWSEKVILCSTNKRLKEITFKGYFLDPTDFFFFNIRRPKNEYKVTFQYSRFKDIDGNKNQLYIQQYTEKDVKIYENT